MKKTTPKTTPTSAEAKTATTPKAVEAAAKKLKAAKAVAPVPAEAKTAAPAPKKTEASKPKAVKEAKPVKVATAKPVSSALPVVTKITASVDVGFGNSLTIRGEGPGLSWEDGVPLVCLDGTSWVWSTTEATKPITFKVLVNDITWCAGEDIVVAPGESLGFSPSF